MSGSKTNTKKLLPRYPWNEWFEQDHFVLEKDTHFDCATHSMGVQVRNRAYRMKIKVSVLLNEEEGLVEVFVKQRGKKKTKYFR